MGGRYKSARRRRRAGLGAPPGSHLGGRGWSTRSVPASGASTRTPAVEGGQDQRQGEHQSCQATEERRQVGQLTWIAETAIGQLAGDRGCHQEDITRLHHYGAPALW